LRSGRHRPGGAINDAATLAAGFSPTGRIIFRAFGSDDPSCSQPSVCAASTDLDAGNGSYVSESFGALEAGTYRWTVSYVGDADNDPVTSVCNAANASSSISKAIPSLTTTASRKVAIGGKVGDTATLAAGTDWEAHLQALRTGRRALLPSPGLQRHRTSQRRWFLLLGQIQALKAGTYRWRATYSGDANNNSVAGACNAPSQSVKVGKR
jgi:hypothetical protein